jgi:RecA-family ATPase
MQREPPTIDAPDLDDFGDEVVDWIDQRAPSAAPLETITPHNWRGTLAPEKRWLVSGLVPQGDLTILAGNGGSGKTEIAVHLLVSVAAGLGDWLGATVEFGLALFLSCEEPEDDIRERIERICRHHAIDPHSIQSLHLHFPKLDATSLVNVGPNGSIGASPLLDQIRTFVSRRKPKLVVIDSAAAVYDGNTLARREVRGFLAMLRRLAIENDVAVVLLDHPSVRGMADGTGTQGNVDWRNSSRSMLYLSDPDREDPDERTLEAKKNNRGRLSEKIKLRWNGLTFSTATSAPSPRRAQAERDVDDLFLRLLDKRNAQGRPVHASNAKGSAPSEFAADPEARGVTSDAFRQAMERLFTARAIKKVETGPQSKRRQHLERAV